MRNRRVGGGEGAWGNPAHMPEWHLDMLVAANEKLDKFNEKLDKFNEKLDKLLEVEKLDEKLPQSTSEGGTRLGGAQEGGSQEEYEEDEFWNDCVECGVQRLGSMC